MVNRKIAMFLSLVLVVMILISCVSRNSSTAKRLSLNEADQSYINSLYIITDEISKSGQEMGLLIKDMKKHPELFVSPLFQKKVYDQMYMLNGCIQIFKLLPTPNENLKDVYGQYEKVMDVYDDVPVMFMEALEQNDVSLFSQAFDKYSHGTKLLKDGVILLTQYPRTTTEDISTKMENLVTKENNELEANVSRENNNEMSIAEATEKSRFATTMRDMNGEEYAVFVIALQENGWIAGPDDIWAGINEGDQIYDGTYQVWLAPKGSNIAYLQAIEIQDYQYNETNKMIFLISSVSKGLPDSLVFAITDSSSSQGGPLYFIHNGEMVKGKFKFKGEFLDAIGYTYRPKAISNGEIQLINYYNAEPVGYEFTNYRFDSENVYFEYTGSKNYLDDRLDEGAKVVELWTEDPAFSVEVK